MNIENYPEWAEEIPIEEFEDNKTNFLFQYLMKWKKDDPRVFIIDQFLNMTIQAGFNTRNKKSKIYADSITISDSNKIELKNAICSILLHAAENITTEIELENEILKINKMSKERFSNILFGNEIRIGICQKLVNLFLKYMWSAKFIKEPLHCPFDRIVIENIEKILKKKQIQFDKLCNWTEMNSIEDYRNYVKFAKIAISDCKTSDNEPMSLAKWELELWNMQNVNKLE